MPVVCCSAVYLFLSFSARRGKLCCNVVVKLLRGAAWRCLLRLPAVYAGVPAALFAAGVTRSSSYRRYRAAAKRRGGKLLRTRVIARAVQCRVDVCVQRAGEPCIYGFEWWRCRLGGDR